MKKIREGTGILLIRPEPSGRNSDVPEREEKIPDSSGKSASFRYNGSMNQMKSWVLVTGASSGIGLEMALLFAEEKYPVILVSSNMENLLRAADRLPEGTDYLLFAENLAQAGGPEHLWKTIQARGLSVEILVNAAGIGCSGNLKEIPVENAGEMVDLNCRALMEMCMLFGRDMMEKGHGRILNVASTGAFQPGPGTAGYYASKAFVLSYSKAIRQELKTFHVQVSCVCPGTTSTHFFEKQGIATPPYAMSARKTARIAYQGLMKGREVIIPGIQNRLMLLLPSRIRMYAVAVLKRKEKRLSGH